MKSEPKIPEIPTVTVTLRATVPLQEYGNITCEVTYNIPMTENTDVQRHLATVQGLGEAKATIAEIILPLAEAEVNRCKSALMRERYPDAWLQRNSPVYRWLRVAAPDLSIPAMKAIIEDENRLEVINQQ